MPMPTPHNGEIESDFMSRCMGDSMMNKDYSDNKQRAAVCHAQFGKKKESTSNIVLNYFVPIKESMIENGEFFIRGNAIHATTTRNGITYTAEELEPSAMSLRNKPILKDHKNEVEAIVGRTTNNVFFSTEEGAVKFEGRIMDTKIKEMIRDGRISSVSVGAMVKELYEDEANNKVVAKGIDFVEISLVAVPADPNAGINHGFACAIQEAFDLKKKQMVIEDVQERQEEIIKEEKMNEEKTPEIQEKIVEKIVEVPQNAEVIAEAVITKLQQRRAEEDKMQEEARAKIVETVAEPEVATEYMVTEQKEFFRTDFSKYSKLRWK